MNDGTHRYVLSGGSFPQKRGWYRGFHCKFVPDSFLSGTFAIFNTNNNPFSLIKGFEDT